MRFKERGLPLVNGVLYASMFFASLPHVNLHADFLDCNFKRKQAYLCAFQQTKASFGKRCALYLHVLCVTCSFFTQIPNVFEASLRSKQECLCFFEYLSNGDKGKGCLIHLDSTGWSFISPLISCAIVINFAISTTSALSPIRCLTMMSAASCSLSSTTQLIHT